MYNGFIKDNVLATSERHGKDHILQQNAINNNNNNNQVLLASNASNLLHNNTTLANGITFVDNLLNQTNDNIKPKKVRVKKMHFSDYLSDRQSLKIYHKKIRRLRKLMNFYTTNISTYLIYCV
jgi:hypothetical protein